MSCKECKWRRAAGNKKMLACGYLSAIKHGFIAVEDLDNDKCPYCGNTVPASENFEAFLNSLEFKNEEIYEGWGYLTRMPDGDQTSLLTRECVIVSPDNECSNFRKG